MVKHFDTKKIYKRLEVEFVSCIILGKNDEKGWEVDKPRYSMMWPKAKTWGLYVIVDQMTSTSSGVALF